VQVWYWPDGTPGFRTTNEVPYAGWGMAQWIEALFEGLAGIYDDVCQMRRVTVSPRWASTTVEKVYVSMRYAASRAYFTYRMEIDYAKKEIHLQCTGSGEYALFRLLLPEGWRVESLDIDGVSQDFHTEEEGSSRYAVFSTALDRPVHCTVSCREN